MADPTKPNILYIMADQMAAPMLAMYNAESVVHTPNLNRLARDGVVFDSAYCNSPLCAPSRFSMVTGQLPSKIGGYDNASNLASDIPTYAHILRRDGYHTALSGKMHFVGPDQLHGFEQRLTSDIYPGDYGWSVNWDEPEVRLDWYHNMSSVLEAGPVVRTNQLDFDDDVIHQATQYLYDHTRHRAPQPFCLTVSMTHPHDPYAMTREYWDLYEGVDIPLPKIPAIADEEQDPHSQRILKCIDLWGKALPAERIRAARRAYFAACSYVDAQVGRLLRTLQDCGLAENTIIVFSGDHGDMLGERGLWYKMNWFEMAARVPLLVHAPTRFPARRVAESVSTMDLLPTFAAMAGSVIPADLTFDGVSLMPYLAGTSGPRPDTVVGEYMGEATLAPLVMIRRGRFKFIYSPCDPPQLYDLVADPAEAVNLAAGCSATLPPSFASSLHASLASSKTDVPAPASPTLLSPLTITTTTTITTAAAAPLTPPRTPQNPPLTGTAAATAGPEYVASVLAAFLAEAAVRWDFDALLDTVRDSQRRRRLVHAALMQGESTSWDWTPPIDGRNMYVRNTGRGPLDDVEWRKRWPRVPVV